LNSYWMASLRSLWNVRKGRRKWGDPDQGSGVQFLRIFPAIRLVTELWSKKAYDHWRYGIMVGWNWSIWMSYRHIIYRLILIRFELFLVLSRQNGTRKYGIGKVNKRFDDGERSVVSVFALSRHSRQHGECESGSWQGLMSG
jgi:hypothetical protein